MDKNFGGYINVVLSLILLTLVIIALEIGRIQDILLAKI